MTPNHPYEALSLIKCWGLHLDEHGDVQPGQPLNQRGWDEVTRHFGAIETVLKGAPRPIPLVPLHRSPADVRPDWTQDAEDRMRLAEEWLDWHPGVRVEWGPLHVCIVRDGHTVPHPPGILMELLWLLRERPAPPAYDSHAGERIYRNPGAA
jgi:hypothetical protein